MATPANSTPRDGRVARSNEASAPPICLASGAASTIGASSARISAARPWASAMCNNPSSSTMRIGGSLMPRSSASPIASNRQISNGAEAAEIRRPPFRDQRQRAAQFEDFLRRQQRIPAIGRAAARDHSAAARMRPSAAPAISATQRPRPPPHRARSARPAPGRTRSRHADWPTAPSAAAARTTARRADRPRRSIRRPRPP